MQSRNTLLLLVSAAALPACDTPGCLSGAEDCLVERPCPELTFTCDAAGFTEVRVIASPEEVPGGIAALGAPGDVLLANDKVVAVIEALDHPHYLAPTGGGLIDLSNRGRDDDSLRQILHATGLLPEDSARYTDLRILDEGDVKAVQVTGVLDGREDIRIATRYEIRPCEPGVRVRTELIHGGVDPIPVLLADGVYFGDRELLPFTPYPGAGFTHPSFGLTTVTDVLREVPYLIAGAHPGADATYGLVACDRDVIEGFHSDIVSAIGAELRLLQPRDWRTYERFVAVSPGPSVSGAADIALEVRRQLRQQPYVRLSGRIAADATDKGAIGRPIRAQVVVAEGRMTDDPAARTPWTHVVPREDGTFEVAVPTDRTYTLEVEAFGRVVATTEVLVGDANVTVPDVSVPPVAELVLDGTVDGAPHELLVFVRPASEQAAEDALGRFLGAFSECAPLLGHPHGGAPACDRVLVDGRTSVAVPPGTYDLVTVAGPFTTLAVERVTLTAGQTTSATLAVTTLPLQPPGTLSADFHVHGGASFDAGIDDADRVRSFLAARVEVIASTEHDVVHDYGPAVAALGAGTRVRVMQGTEATGHVLFPLYEQASFPKVIGHWNVWPVPYDATSPWRGAPWDERVEPGALLDRMVERGWDPTTGVAQLNHPWGGFQFGRDFGWTEAIELDLTRPLPQAYDGTGPSLFLRTPPGSAFSNADFHVQEVMNGSANGVYQPYRAAWFYLLDQGVVRGGTANSDTHTLTENVTGFPRNVVWTDTTLADFDPTAFHRAVRDGRMLGTNGPVLEVTLTDAEGTSRTPSLTPFTPAGQATLRVVVRAAPWVPVDEVRIVVDGRVARTITELPAPTDPFGADDLDRLDIRIPLEELAPGTRDAWIVVEAGHPLVPLADLDCDGWPETGDNDGNGTIDWRDVDGLDADPGDGCLEDAGPLQEPPPAARGEPGEWFSVVVPGGRPTAFTNPLLLDRDGGGFGGVSR